jgi:hypothetical protein
VSAALPGEPLDARLLYMTTPPKKERDFTFGGWKGKRIFLRLSPRRCPVATRRINRKDFGVNWKCALDRGGLAVGDDIDIMIDAETILEG